MGKQPACPPARGPAIEQAEYGLRLRRVGEFEAQRIEKDHRDEKRQNDYGDLFDPVQHDEPSPVRDRQARTDRRAKEDRRPD